MGLRLRRRWYVVWNVERSLAGVIKRAGEAQAGRSLQAAGEGKPI